MLLLCRKVLMRKISQIQKWNCVVNCPSFAFPNRVMTTISIHNSQGKMIEKLLTLSLSEPLPTNFANILREHAASKNSSISVPFIVKILDKEFINKFVSPVDLVNVVWALSRLQIKFKVKREMFFDLVDQFCEFKIISRGLVKEFFHEMSSIGVRFHELSDNQQITLFYHLNRTLYDMNHSEFSYVLSSLPKMGLIWDELPDDIQRAIQFSLEKNTNYFDEKSCVFVVNAFGKLFYKLTDADVETFDTINKLAEINLTSAIHVLKTKSQFNGSQSIANTLSSLANMQANYKTLLFDLQGTINKKLLVESFQDMDNYGILQTLLALGKINMSWSDLTYESRKNVKNVLQNRLLAFSDIEFVNVVKGLANMGVKHTDFSFQFLEIFDESLMKNLLLPSMREKLLVELIIGLSTVKYIWPDMSPELQSGVLVAVTSKSKTNKLTKKEQGELRFALNKIYFDVKML